MPSIVFNSTATNNDDLYNKVIGHLTSTAMGASVVAGGSNVGNGGINSIIYKSTSLPQTLTITCTAATANGGTFSVVGSITGAMGTALVGTAFDHIQLGFTIADGVIDFSIGDVFTLVSASWVELKAENLADNAPHTNRRASYLRGPGISNADKIYVVIHKFDNLGADQFIWQFRGATDFDTNQTFEIQPGSSNPTNFPIWDSAMDYWLIANGRRFILIVKVAGIFFAAYCGFILPYGTSSEYPYPLYIAGASSGNNIRYSVSDFNISNFWSPNWLSAYYRDIDGSWLPIINVGSAVGNYSGVSQSRNTIVPYSIKNIEIGNNADGSYGLLQPQLVLRTTGNDRVEGVLEGLQYVSGFANAPEDIIQIAGYPNDFLVVPNTYRTQKEQFAAIELG